MIGTEPEIPSGNMGHAVLLNISKAAGLNQWMFESIRPYVKGRILEVGSGIGNISAIFVRRKIPLFLSDFKEEYCRVLKKNFDGQPEVGGIFQIDLADKDFDVNCAGLLGTFDTVFALNVVEHIKDDSLAVKNCYKLLAPGGHLILLMPAYRALYNRFDEELGHCRRYARSTINRLLSNDFEVLKIWYFNLAGIFGWWFFGSVLRRKIISKRQMDIYEKLILLFRFADWLTLRRVGLSVIGVGRKK